MQHGIHTKSLRLSVKPLVRIRYAARCTCMCSQRVIDLSISRWTDDAFVPLPELSRCLSVNPRRCSVSSIDIAISQQADEIYLKDRAVVTRAVFVA